MDTQHLQNHWATSHNTFRTMLLKWWPTAAILALALLFRVGYIDNRTGLIDLIWFTGWMKAALEHGLFNIYASGINYPPLYLILLSGMGTIQTLRGLPLDWNQIDLLRMYKLVPMAAELISIGAVSLWVQRSAVGSRTQNLLRWAALVWLAISPGLIIVTVWRGQIDSIVIMFSVLALLAFAHDHPRWAWSLWALALLTKQIAFFIGPLFVVLTFRRYGWRTLLHCVGWLVAIHLVALTPFLFGSGLQNVLNIYLGIANHNQELTAHALNFWSVVNPIQPAIPPNTIPIVGGLTARIVGLVLFGTADLLIMVNIWRHPHKRYEFVWATALNFSFFLFLTGVFERYLFYTAALLPIAILQEPKLWWVALGVTYTFTLNNISIWIDYAYQVLGTWLGWFIWQAKFYTLAGILNIGMFFEVLRILGVSGKTFQWLFQVGRGATIVIGLLLVYLILREPLSYYPTARWLSEHIATTTRIGTESVGVTQYAHDLQPLSGWDWRLESTVENRSIQQWQAEGVEYLVVDEWASATTDFTARVNQLVAQGSTLVYQTPSLLRLNSRQAVLWTRRPQYPMDLLFDNSLRLVGYDVSYQVPNQSRNQGEQGQPASLILYWQIAQPTTKDYHVFVHLVDSENGAMLGQLDAMLGQFVRPSATWRLYEIVSERYDLPPTKPGQPFNLRVGLYQFSSGRRAEIVDQAGVSRGDSHTIMISVAQQ